MAKKKNQNAQGLTRKQLTKIWKHLGADEWLKMLKEYQPDSKAVTISKGTVKAICPRQDHADSDPSFHIHSHDNKQFARCFGGGCQFYTANPIELASHIMQVSELEALNYLRDKYSITYLPRKAQEELIARKVNQDVKQVIYAAAHEYMCNALAEPDKYPAAKKPIDWLVTERHIPAEHLHALPVGILPSLQDLNKILTAQYKRRYDAWRKRQVDEKVDLGSEPEDRVDAAIEYLAMTFRNEAFNGSVLWPLHSGPKHISRLKLRVPDKSKEITIPDDKYEEELGLYGLGWEPYHDLLYSSAKQTKVVLVEGEMDAMSVMAGFLQTGDITFPIISVGGVGGAPYLESTLSALGIDKAYLVGDSPDKGAGGDVVVQDWLKKIDKLDSRIFVGWEHLSPAGDFDDVINHPSLGIDAIRKHVWEDIKENFIPPWHWAFERAQAELSLLDANERRQMVECATKHGQYLINRLECSAFVDAVTNAYPVIPASTLKLDIATHENTERGYVHRIRETLREMFWVVGSYADKGTRSLVLYHRENKQYHKIQIDSAHSLAQELAPLVGSLVDFAQDKIGYPEDLLPSLDDDGRNLGMVNKALQEYMRDALNGLAQGAVNINAAPQLRQGYHYMEDTLTHELTGEYIVCGKDVFSIIRDRESSSYVELPGPVDNGYVFHGDFDGAPPKSWYPGGLSVEKLERGADVDLASLYKDIKQYLNFGFTFKNDDITSQFLAAVFLTLPIMDCFDRPLVLFVTGESNSGKSTLLASLAGGGIKQLQLLYASQIWTRYSESSVAQHGADDSRLMVLDEFESKGRNSGAIEAIFELYRGLVNGSATRTKSTQHGTGTINRFIKHPVVLAGIAGAEKEQDLNRIVQVEMKRVQFKDGPAIAIEREMGLEKIKEMARDIAVGMYPHVPKLKEYAKEIQHEFAEFQSELKVKVEYRYVSGLYSVFAVMKLIGLDWKEFFKEYVIRNERVFTAVNSSSESENLWKAMLSNPKVVDTETKAVAPILPLLRDSMQWDMINSSATGVYYDESTQLLLVLAEQALTRLVPESYRRITVTTAQRLKEILNRHPAALTPAQVEESDVIKHLEKHMGCGIEWQDVVVIRANNWLLDPDEAGDVGEKKGVVTSATPGQMHAKQPTSNDPSEEKEQERHAKESRGVDW